jgi:SsrA-binding protein
MTTLVHNKKVSFDYEILDQFEAGIELSGIEVKSVKAGRAALDGAYVTVRGGEAFLMNADIAPYQPANTPENYDPKQRRKLLLKKPELARLATEESKKGLTLVPISLYNKGRRIKVSIAIVRGKKKFDKRQTLKKRTSEREVAREYGL